ncbi:MAG TPA: hypothetical protein DCR04_05895 [Flavobacteriales bacterium]|nr:hypothetical protein [Flavobacteriales bacterium]
MIVKKIFPIALVLLLTGCAFHSGYITDSAALSEANFTYTNQVSGSASATYVFGLGGLARKGLVAEAREVMRRQKPLGPNEAYANISVNWKSTWVFMVLNVKCMVTADIVKFNKTKD